MSSLVKKSLFGLAVSILFLSLNGFSQVVLNEICPANSSIVANNGNYDDWFELYNKGASAVNLNGYGASHDTLNYYDFRFPSYVLDPGKYILVFASGKNNTNIVDHWETAVNASTTWKYFVGTTAPDTNWRNPGFNDNAWTSGPGGIGYGYSNQVTTVSPSPCRSVMMRKKFVVTDTSQVMQAVFNMDYDDGFVAFLNGVEIARANIGVPGDRPTNTTLATGSHQAKMYLGQAPDSFAIDPVFLKSILRPDTNILAVEIHNSTPTSNDILGIPFLSFGMRTGHINYSLPPSWFRVPLRQYFESNFHLGKTGATLFLSDSSNHIVDQHTWANIDVDNAIGRIPDGSNTWCFINHPTPDSTNNSVTCYTGYATIPLFSLSAGFYPSSQILTISTGMPGGVIHYMTDGSAPTTSSPVYSGPIHLDTTQTVRARVFATGYLPSPEISNTYFIGEDVHLPIFSLNTDPANLWDYNTGIYVEGPNASPNYPYFGANYWQGWEKPVSVEFFTKDKIRAFKFNSLFSVSGNYSMTKPQKSFEIKLSSAYGTSSITYPLIPDKSYITNYNDFILRNAGTDWMVVHYRDDLQERILKTTDVTYNASEPCVVFLNGEFWGVYQIRQNSDHHQIEQEFGYTKDQIDLLYEKGPLTVHEGSDTAFYSMYNYAKTANHADTSFYTAMSQYWDLGSFTDNFVAETYYCNEDWVGPWTNNIKFWRPIKPGGKWQYLMNDLDFGLGYASHPYDNMLDTVLHPQIANYQTDQLTYMLENPIYKNYFINRYADLINTIFLPSNINSEADAYHDSTAYDMNRQFSIYGGDPVNWTANINHLKDFVNRRPQYARDYIQGEFGLTSQVTLTLNVSPAGAGRIQISTVSPTTYPWSGVYFNGNPVKITAIPNPGYTFNHWRSNVAIPSNNTNQSLTLNFTSTDQITAYFTGSNSPVKLTVSEINYHSDSTFDTGDWFELHNYGNTSIDISNWIMRDGQENHRYKIPVGTVIAANGYLVVASDLQKFNAIHPSISNVIGPMNFDLSNAGDEIRVFDYRDSLYLSLNYQDTPPWPVEADGQGFTCELVSPTGNLSDGNNWFAGCHGGSPGRAYSNSLGNQLHIRGNITFCSGRSTVLSVQSVNGYTYQWRKNNSNINGATDSSLTVNSNGNYYVHVSYLGCSSWSDTVNVHSVSSAPDPVVTDASSCQPGSLTLAASASDTIYWYDAPGGNIVQTGSSFTTPVLASSTTYYAQTSQNCPSNLVPVHAVINTPSAPPTASDVTRCGPGTALLIATDTAAVRWYNSNGALLIANDTFLTPTIYTDTTFYAEAGSICPSVRIPVHVFISSSTTPIGNDASRCGTGTVVLTASSPDPIFWYDAPSGGNQVGAGSLFTTPVLDTVTIYYAEANSGCPSPRIQVQAEVFPIPPAPLVADTSVCGPVAVSLNANSLEQIFWYDAPVGGNQIGSGSVFTTQVLSSNAVYYVEDGYICRSPRTEVHVGVNLQHDPPTVNGAVVNCGPGSFALHASAQDSIFWYDQPAGGTLLASDSVFTTPILTSSHTYYAVSGTVCPSASVPATVTILPLPVVILGPDTLGIFSGQIVTLNAGSGYSSYLWSTGATTQTINVGIANTYSVTVKDSNQCNGTSQIVVTIINGVTELTSEESFDIYPNPARDQLTVRILAVTSQRGHLVVTDPDGRLLQEQDVKLFRGMNMIPLDLENYAKGLYFIRFESHDKVKTLRVTIE